MKLSLTLLFAAFSGVSAAFKTVAVSNDIKADSDLGMNLLSKARRLEQQEEQQEAEEEVSWVAGYSLKFQGCHHIQEWNADADDNNDVRIATRRLVRFRLCPSSSCSASKAAGCGSGYGDYVIDMGTFVQAYVEASRRKQEYDCEMYLNYQCDCEDDDGKGDDFDRDYCEYDCFNNAGMTDCVDRNPYEDDEQQKEEFNIDEYLECAGYEPPANEDDGGRRLEDAGDDEAQYYVGPYCAEQGGSIYLGLFSDDACTEFLDEQGGASTYKTLSGESLPYASTSIVGMECVSCLEQKDANGNDDANQDEDNVSEQCEEVYQAAGKCESSLPGGTVNEVNENACKYIEGIKIVRKDGIVDVSAARRNPVVTAFIVIFAMAFAALGFYVWYLRMRLGVKKNALI